MQKISNLVSLLPLFENGSSRISNNNFGPELVEVDLNQQVENLPFGVADLGDEILVEESLNKGVK